MYAHAQVKTINPGSLNLHKAPTPEPVEEPLPGEHPVPQEDPVPSPNPETGNIGVKQ